MREMDEAAAVKPPAARLFFGGAIFILGLALPVLTPLVLASGLSATMKTALSGFIILGLPEILMFVSAAVLGKSGFNWLKARLFAIIRKAAPSAKVGRTRYYAGTVILTVLLAITVVEPFLVEFFPKLAQYRILYTSVLDIIFVVNLFVLGGDFWDKLRALFSYDAKAQFPQRSS